MTVDSTTKEVRPEVTEELIENFRKRIITEHEENPDIYDNRDIERIKENNGLCKRYLRHKRCNLDDAVAFAKNSLKWRKEFAVNDIRAEDLPDQLWQENAFFPYNYDKNGAHVLVLRAKFYQKEAKYHIYYKKCVIYFFEQLLFERKAKCITFLFDCVGASISNFDIEMVKFAISLFRDYYPYSMGFVIVHQMPWLFNACWNVVKGMLPAEGVARIKFTKSNNIQEYIDQKNLPQYLGGDCDYEYKYVKGNYLGERCPMGGPDLVKST